MILGDGLSRLWGGRLRAFWSRWMAAALDAAAVVILLGAFLAAGLVVVGVRVERRLLKLLGVEHVDII